MCRFLDELRMKRVTSREETALFFLREESIIGNMDGITISRERIAKSRGIVVLPIKEYYRLLMVPTYQLKGKAAEKLDKLVEEGLREYREGKTIKASSLKEALKIYAKRAKR